MPFILTRAPLRSLALPSVVALLAGCSGGGSSAPAAPHASQTTLQRVSGILQIGVPPSTSSLARIAGDTRRPDFVAAQTKHAALFIDGAATAAGSTTSCSPTSCSISWSATLNVPAKHTFAVEADDGGVNPVFTSGIPYVLAEGSGSYAIVAGSGNSLSTLSLNGAAEQFYLGGAPSCASGSCSLGLAITTSQLAAITYTGSAYSTPVEGQNPTSGEVFDNDGGGADPVIVTADSNIGRLTGAAQSPYSTYDSTAAALTIRGVSPNGYTMTFACAANANGKFGVKVSGAATPSNDVTTAELSGLSPAVQYGPGGTTSPDGDYPTFFTCTNGSISASGAASGSLPVG